MGSENEPQINASSQKQPKRNNHAANPSSGGGTLDSSSYMEDLELARGGEHEEEASD